MHLSSSSGFRDSSSSGGNTGGTEKPVATGNDEILPSDCGRDPKKGNGLLCFPDGKLCAESKIMRPTFVEYFLRVHICHML